MRHILARHLPIFEIMNITKRTALHLSLSIIVFYWLYELFVVKHNGIPLGNFFDFVIKIVTNKVIHLAVIILLLRIEKDGWNDMGFRLKNWRRQFLIGILLGFFMFLLLNIGLISILNSIFPVPAASGSIFAYFSEPQNLYIWLAVAF